MGPRPVVLVDTSVWIQTFRRTRPLQLESEVDLDDVVTCLPVVQEVLQVFDLEEHYRRAHTAMWSFPVVESPLTPVVIDEAVNLYRCARRAGLTIRSGVDCLIAACATRHDLNVLHNGRDFGALARISQLQERQPRKQR